LALPRSKPQRQYVTSPSKIINLSLHPRPLSLPISVCIPPGNSQIPPSRARGLRHGAPYRQLWFQASSQTRQVWRSIPSFSVAAGSKVDVGSEPTLPFTRSVIVASPSWNSTVFLNNSSTATTSKPTPVHGIVKPSLTAATVPVSISSIHTARVDDASIGPPIGIPPIAGVLAPAAPPPPAPDPLPPITDPNSDPASDQIDKSGTQGRQSTTIRSSSQSSTPSLTVSTSTTSSGSIRSCPSCTACPTLSFNLSSIPDLGDDDGISDENNTKRSMAKRGILEKRRDGDIQTRLGRGLGGPSCLVQPSTLKPKYPGPYDVSSWDNNRKGNPIMTPFFQTAKYWAVPTELPDCGGPDWVFRDTHAVQVPAAPGDDIWQIGGSSSNQRIVNIDHVYEVQLLDQFFTSRITPAFNCTDISMLFDSPDWTDYDPSGPAPLTSVGTRLNTIFAQLASYEHPDFLGMDGDLNRLKGYLWNAHTLQPFGLQGMPLVVDNLDYLNGLAAITVVMNMANNASIRGLFQSTNQRIYKAFAGIDEVIRHEDTRSCPLQDHNQLPMSATWASAYSKWMTDKISLQNLLIVATASQYSAGVPTVALANALPGDMAQTEGWSSWMSNYNLRYRISALTFPAVPDWPAGHLPIQKRQGLAPNGSCMTVNPSQSTSQATSAAPGSIGRLAHAEPTQSRKSYTPAQSASRPTTTNTAVICRCPGQNHNLRGFFRVSAYNISQSFHKRTALLVH